MEDGLTGLANRRKFDEAIEVEWRRALRNKDYLSTILLDIDHFKAFNDTYGHQSGDECLKKVAECLKKQTRRAGELNARYGGEEFVIVLPGTPIKNALYVAESIRSSIFDMRIPHAGSAVSQYVTISAGVSSTIPVREYNSSALIRKADLELYQAKREGRNRVVGNELKHITTG
jgi:diguanylate cyclase (GGDEF)-like protein